MSVQCVKQEVKLSSQVVEGIKNNNIYIFPRRAWEQGE